jgi:hypothetical protein
MEEKGETLIGKRGGRTMQAVDMKGGGRFSAHFPSSAEREAGFAGGESAASIRTAS